MKRTLLATIAFTLLWVLLSMHTEPLIIACGVASIAGTIAIARRLEILDSEGAPYELNLRLPGFLIWLTKEVVMANLQVAKIILSRKIDITPHMILVPASQKTPLGQAIHANTITITPGTISLDVDGGVILVHALTREAASQDDSGDTDKVISWVEGTGPNPFRLGAKSGGSEGGEA